VLAKVGDDAVVSVSKRGEGQVVFVSVSLGLGVDQRPVPVLGLLMRELVEGLVPVTVSGEVEWAINKLPDGWAVTLLNNRGVIKPQHGILPTEHGQEQYVTIRTSVATKSAKEWMTDAAVEVMQEGETARMRVVVPAGGVRIVEMK
jgi:hypothetical protein